MGREDLRIVFMGTPEFAVAALDELISSGFHVVGVITAPDKYAGRGMKLQECAVKKYAAEKGLHILQPVKLKDEEFLNDLKKLNADLQVVVAFRMLPQAVWAMPPMGTINVHGSLLPQYRGAAPINWAIINGEKETGVTTFKLKQDIDTGNILLQEKISIGENETAGELHDRMKIRGAKLLIRTLDQLIEGDLEEKPQTIFTHEQAPTRNAPKIFTDTCKIDFSKSVDEVYNLIRGLSPYPGAFTTINGKILKIFKCIKEYQKIENSGDIKTDQKTYLKFSCANGLINVSELQLEGKKRMKTEEYLRGNKFNLEI